MVAKIKFNIYRLAAGLGSFLLVHFCWAQTIKKQPFIIGETLQFHSKLLQEDRSLNIYLPAGYHPDSAKTYPVIYLLDGSADEDFIHVAGLVQFANFPWIKMLPESIVVGIANVDRQRDFTFPTTIEKDKKDFPTTGGSARFIDFLEHELQPLVRTRYKINGQSTIIGQSLGGLLATEILFKKPDLFNNYIIVSPSLWWDKESLLQLKPVASAKPEKVYIAVGKEGKVMEGDAKALYRKWKALAGEKSATFFRYFPKQTHADVLHLAVYDAFERLFRVEKK